MLDCCKDATRWLEEDGTEVKASIDNEPCLRWELHLRDEWDREIQEEPEYTYADIAAGYVANHVQELTEDMRAYLVRALLYNHSPHIPDAEWEARWERQRREREAA